MLKTLLNMTKERLEPNTPSSISLDDIWEAIRIHEYFIFQKRKDIDEKNKNNKIVTDKDNLVHVEYPNDRIEELRLEVLSNEESFIPSPSSLNEILPKNLQVIIHNIPKNSKLIIR